MEHVGDVRIFGGEGAFPNPCGIGCQDADDSIHAIRRKSGAGASTARSGVGGGDEWIGAVVNVQEGALRAFEKDLLFALGGFVQPDDGVRNEWREVIAGAAVIIVNFL